VRIAVVHSYYSAAQPSGENIAVDMQVEALRDRGHTVCVVSRNTDDHEKSVAELARLAISVATGRGPDPTDELHSFSPDVVHVHNLFPNWGTTWLQRWRGPMVATLHNFRAMCAAGTLYRAGQSCELCPAKGSHLAVVHACYRGSRFATVPLAVRTRGGVGRDPLITRTDRLVVLAERSKSTYEHWGVDPQRMRTVPNFTQHQTVTIGEPQDPWVYLGRLTEEKGVLDILTGWPTDVPLDIYGSGPLEAEVRERATRLVRFRGLVTPAASRKVVTRARGLVLPSRCAEGAAPLTYLEALAAGRPVVAREGSSAADDIRIGGTGIVYHSQADLAQAVRQANSNAAAYGWAARARFEERYSVTSWLETIEAVYNEVVDDRKR
jgi:glycosyltransferase involved in cell wall biosynthesis